MAYTVAEAEVKVLPNADGFGDLAKAQIAEQADSIGREAGDRIGKGIQERVRASLAELPDAKIGVDIDQGKLDATLAEVKAKTDAAGETSGRSMGDKLAKNAADSAGHGSPLIVAAIVGGLLAGAPAVVAAGGLVMGALAGVIAAQSPEVQHAAAGVGTAFSDAFGEAGKVTIPFFVQALNTVKDAATGLAAQAAPAFAALQGPLDGLVNGVVGMVTNLMPGLVATIEKGTPVFQGLGDLLAKLGTGLSNLFSIAADHSQAAGRVFSSLGDILGSLLPILGQLIGAGAELGATILPPLAAILQVVANVLNAISPALPVLLAGVTGLFIVSKLGPLFASLAASLEATGASAMVTVETFTASAAAGEALGTGFEVAAAGARGLEAAMGPIGWVIAGISLVLPFFISGTSDADKAQQKLTSSTQSLTQALQQSKGAIDDNVRANAAQQAQANGLFDYADQIGVSYSTMTDAILGNSDALQTVKNDSDSYKQSLGDMGMWSGAMAKGLDTSYGSVVKLSGSVKTEVGNQQQLAKAMEGTSDVASINAARLQGVANSASQANSEVSQLKAALDALTGKTVSLDDAQVAVSNAVNSAATALKGQKGEVLDGTGALNLHTQAGTAAYGVLKSLRDASNAYIGVMEQQGSTTADVSAKDADLRAQFYKTALQLTGSKKAAEDLTNSIYGIPTQRNVEITADTAAATQAAANFKVYWDSITSRKVTLTVDGAGNSVGVQFGNRTTGTIAKALGGIVHPFAGGGFEPMAGGVAQVVAPQTYRVIGDNLTSDEAYIPINDSARSLAILAQTAGRMGYGLAPAGAPAGKTDARSYVFQITAPSTDPAALAREIRSAQLDLEFLHG